MNKSVQTNLVCVTLASLNGEVDVTNSHQCRPWIKLEITRFIISVNRFLHVIVLFFPHLFFTKIHNNNTQDGKSANLISSAYLCTLGHYGAVFVHESYFF
jgi:hypothetical protein